MNNVPRIRMFAGPNGSGKSTFKSLIRPELVGIYINPDEIEKEIRSSGFLDLTHYHVSTTEQEVLAFFSRSSLLKKAIGPYGKPSSSLPGLQIQIMLKPAALF